MVTLHPTKIFGLFCIELIKMTYSVMSAKLAYRLCLFTYYGTKANRVATDVMPLKSCVPSGAIRLLFRFSSKNEIKMKKLLLIPLKMKVDS